MYSYSWIMQSDYEELDVGLAEVQLGICRKMREIVEAVLENRNEKLQELARELSEIASPLYNYPNKIYVELVHTKIVRYLLGEEDKASIIKTVEEFSYVWPSCSNKQ